MKTNNRQNNYDLLRILSAAAVVFIHINQHYMALPTPKSFTTRIVLEIIEVFTRFCVPCFVMMSGAFLLSDPLNKNYGNFYKRRFMKIILPFLIVSLFFMFYDFISGVELRKLFWRYLYVEYYNLWFMPMIAGLYLLTPVVIRFKESVSAFSFGAVALVWLCAATFFQNLGDNSLPYSFTKVFSYLGYFMLGSYIYENLKGRIKPISAFLTALTVYTVRIVLRITNLTWIFRDKNVYFYPTIIVGALAVFAAFTNLNIKKSFEKLARPTMYVYLLHSFVFELTVKTLGEIYIINDIVSGFIMSAVSFFVSYFIGLIIVNTEKRLKCRKK